MELLTYRTSSDSAPLHSRGDRLRFLRVHVQILLGHVNIATTAVYTHLTEPTRISLRSVLDKLMAGL
jgi:site-specific recombinase XerC